MNRTGIINYLITKYCYNKYLEIGVQKRNQNFEKIICKYKQCVDPDSKAKADFILTSDDFFAQNNETFDVVFIDGLHYCEQVFKDVINSLKVLNKNGTIVCHDMLPINEIEQKREISYFWTGDCWKAWFKCRSIIDDIEMFVIDTDHGVGIIRQGKQKKISIDEELTWEFFCNNKKLMNIITVEQFLNKDDIT